MVSLLIVLLVAGGCAAYQFAKGTLVKSFVLVVTSISSSIAAFGYFELLGNVFLNKITNPKFMPWLQPLSFVLLFALTFAILNTIASQLTKKEIDLDNLLEKAGRVVCGLFAGLILSGAILTTLNMAPLPNQYPYQRYDKANPNVDRPKGSILNTDGFTTGWFNLVSAGSLSGKKSFSAIHPDFLNQSFLNRLYTDNEVTLTSNSDAIEVPGKTAFWPAPDSLKDTDGYPINPKSAHNLTMVRIGITKNAIKQKETAFAISQLKLICRENSASKNPLFGKAKNAYPIGYIKAPNTLQTTSLSDKITISKSDVSGKVRWIDFAFYVPNGYTPNLVAYKQNSIVTLPGQTDDDQTPETLPFIQLSKCATDTVDFEAVKLAELYPIQLAAGKKTLKGTSLKFHDPNSWKALQSTRSITPARFIGDKITFVRAELIIKGQSSEDQEEAEGKARPRRTKRKYTSPSRDSEKEFREMLRPLKDYKLLSLKCSNPSTGKAVSTAQLPVLVELSGLVHRPVGVVAAGEIKGDKVYEVDYCALTNEDAPEGLLVSDDNTVTLPDFKTIWITESADSVTEFFVLYLVSTSSKQTPVITSVRPGNSKTPAVFKEYEGFLVN